MSNSEILARINFVMANSRPILKDKELVYQHGNEIVIFNPTTKKCSYEKVSETDFVFRTLQL
jgi:hypothetical protein